MKPKKITNIIIGLLFISNMSFAQEMVSDLENKSTSVVNEELRKNRKSIAAIKWDAQTTIDDNDLVYYADGASGVKYSVPYSYIKSNMNDAAIQSIFSVFGGDGSAGDVTVSGATNFSTIDSPQYILQANNFTIDAGQTLTINEGFAFIAVKGDCHIHGTITADSQGALGGQWATGGSVGRGSLSTVNAHIAEAERFGLIVPTIGVGGAGGGGKVNGGTTPYGGGSGAEGGETGLVGHTTPTWKTGIIDWAVGPSNLLAILIASRGGGGGDYYNIELGGNGGGVIYIEVAGELIFDGTLTSDGGSTANYAGGGGGGTIIIRAKTITTNTGSVTTTGGLSSGSGNGAAGYNKIVDM